MLLAEDWSLDSQESWKKYQQPSEGIELKDGTVAPTGAKATFKSTLKSFDKKTQASSITLSQVPTWMNWNASPQIGPQNLRDAPICLRVGRGDYWMFGRFGGTSKRAKGKKGQDKKAPAPAQFEAKPAKLEGFDIPLVTTPYPNQFNAPGGLKKGLGGYHAWQSKDMKNWVHHGPVSDGKAKWMTTAEQVDGKTYLYYDFPNDQDPHLIIDEDLTDGELGKKMGIALNGTSLRHFRG